MTKCTSPAAIILGTLLGTVFLTAPAWATCLEECEVAPVLQLDSCEQPESVADPCEGQDPQSCIGSLETWVWPSDQPLNLVVGCTVTCCAPPMEPDGEGSCFSEESTVEYVPGLQVLTTDSDNTGIAFERRDPACGELTSFEADRTFDAPGRYRFAYSGLLLFQLDVVEGEDGGEMMDGMGGGTGGGMTGGGGDGETSGGSPVEDRSTEGDTQQNQADEEWGMEDEAGGCQVGTTRGGGRRGFGLVLGVLLGVLVVQRRRVRA